LEVKIILDYLRVINQPDNNDALARIINVPSRRIGETSIKSLIEEADEAKITLWSLVLAVVQGKRRAKTRLPMQTDQALSRFVNIILTARRKWSESKKESRSVPDLIKFVVGKVDYENWLVDYHGDVHKSRWANVEELITQASSFQDLVSRGDDDDALPQIDQLEQTEDEDWLPKFLANVALASEVKTDSTGGTPTAQVTISTIHAAKGLEWPVVFIPSTYEGSIPHSRSEDTNEERRIFYVAMTRAKVLLYMSCPLKNSRSEETSLSPFLAPAPLAPLLDQKGPSLGAATVQTIALILSRGFPSTESIKESSVSLLSSEDNLFPLRGDEDEALESKWPPPHMAQQAPKRRRGEFGRSVSNTEEGSANSWKPTYATTMERAASFTGAGAGAGFMSAGSHMQALKEQSVNCVAETEVKGDDLQENPKKKAMRQKPKVSESQNTILGFLGKSKPEPSQPPVARVKDVDCAKGRCDVPNGFVLMKNLNETRNARTGNESAGIAPALALHRLGTNLCVKPQSRSVADQHRRNDYVFLSSSPPRQITAEDAVMEQPADVTKPPLMPVPRPALSTHRTTMSMLENSRGSAKTYGVKRSMEGWKNKGVKAFKPPTMRRPQ
jgi:DNA helicase-2/ATP-dependent DNA helicase PcrA